jgi:hypothetical protein
MYKKIFNHLNQFSLKRGLIVGSVSYIQDLYNKEKVEKTFIKTEDLSDELLSKTKDFETILDMISRICNANTIFNQHLAVINKNKKMVEEPKIVWTNNATTIAEYDSYNNSIILGTAQVHRINNFVIAHEYAHYKFDRPKNYEKFISPIAYGLLATSPITAGLLWTLSGCLILSPELLDYGGFVNANIVEDRADKFALKFGFAKEGYEFFKSIDDNDFDTEHALSSLRRGQAFEAMVKKNHESNGKSR